MAEFYVTHIELKERNNYRSGIAKLRGNGPQGVWTYTKEEVITKIKKESTYYAFLVKRGTAAASRVLVAGAPPSEYLTTSPDGTGVNNLLELPQM